MLKHLYDTTNPDTESPANGFKVRDMLRFFAVDIILILSLRLLLDLGIFPSLNSYVLGILASKMLLLGYLFWLIHCCRDAWPETGVSRFGRWWAWPVAVFMYAGFYPILVHVTRLNHSLMEKLYAWFGWVYTPEPQDVMVLIFEDILANPIRLTLVVFAALVGPFMEELAFRGLGLDAFKRSRGLLWALFWTSLLFGMYHFTLSLLLPLSLLGLLFGIVRALSGGLWCAVFIHVLHNCLALLIMAHEVGAITTFKDEWQRLSTLFG